MTNEEATKILKYEIFKFAQSRDMQECSTQYCDAIKIAIDSLRTQQTTKKLDRSQWDGCPFCRGKEDDRNDENHILRQRYCDVCGKPLTELAWVELERKIGGSNGTTD